jgi:hypothetical protein
MSTIPYDLVSVNPSFTLDSAVWGTYMSAPGLRKRQQLSSAIQLTADQLYALCPLNDVQNPEVPAGCLAGIYSKFCKDISTPEKLLNCHSAYDQVFTVSIFKPIGDVCPAWKYGPRSFECAITIRNFKFELPYITVTSDHAANLVRNILASPLYAPCHNTTLTKCNWLATISNTQVF